MYSIKVIVLAVVATFLVTAALIYLTPLKWIAVVEPNINDIDPKEFYTNFVEHPDNYIFIDVRQPDAYNNAHAKGSVNQPIGTLFDGHKLLPRKGKEIVLICSSGRLAGVAYGFLQHLGFFNIMRIEGGVQGWALENLPLEGANLAAPIPTRD